jgi:hypothetical protein
VYDSYGQDEDREPTMAELRAMPLAFVKDSTVTLLEKLEKETRKVSALALYSWGSGPVMLPRQQWITDAL